MNINTISSQEFDQHASRARKAAARGPIFIADRGKLTHVLLTIEEYKRRAGKRCNILDALAMPGVAEIDFDPPRLKVKIRPAEFS